MRKGRSCSCRPWARQTQAPSLGPFKGIRYARGPRRRKARADLYGLRRGAEGFLGPSGPEGSSQRVGEAQERSLPQSSFGYGPGWWVYLEVCRKSAMIWGMESQLAEDEAQLLANADFMASWEADIEKARNAEPIRRSFA